MQGRDVRNASLSTDVFYSSDDDQKCKFQTPSRIQLHFKLWFLSEYKFGLVTSIIFSFDASPFVHEVVPAVIPVPSNLSDVDPGHASTYAYTVGLQLLLQDDHLPAANPTCPFMTFPPFPQLHSSCGGWKSDSLGSHLQDDQPIYTSRLHYHSQT